MTLLKNAHGGRVLPVPASPPTPATAPACSASAVPGRADRAGARGHDEGDAEHLGQPQSLAQEEQARDPCDGRVETEQDPVGTHADAPQGAELERVRDRDPEAPTTTTIPIAAGPRADACPISAMQPIGSVMIAAATIDSASPSSPWECASSLRASRIEQATHAAAPSPVRHPGPAQQPTRP